MRGILSLISMPSEPDVEEESVLLVLGSRDERSRSISRARPNVRESQDRRRHVQAGLPTSTAHGSAPCPVRRGASRRRSARCRSTDPATDAREPVQARGARMRAATTGAWGRRPRASGSTSPLSRFVGAAPWSRGSSSFRTTRRPTGVMLRKATSGAFCFADRGMAHHVEAPTTPVDVRAGERGRLSLREGRRRSRRARRRTTGLQGAAVSQ